MNKRFATDSRKRLSAICLSLPEGEASSRTGQHMAYSVRGKKFCYHTVDHHGDGRVALSCKAASGVQDLLVRSDPQRYFVPPYIGPKGWVGLDLGAAPVDWDEVAQLVADSYRLIAPKRLAAAAPSAFDTFPCPKCGGTMRWIPTASPGILHCSTWSFWIRRLTDDEYASIPDNVMARIRESK